MANPLDNYHGDIVEESFKYKINFLEWWEFREKIKAGADVNLIVRKDGSQISNDLKNEFSTFGRTNYIVYNSIASAFDNIETINKVSVFDANHLFNLRKLISETYYHFGVALDNISRIIYILFCDGKVDIRIIKDIDYGKLKKRVNNNSIKGFALNEPAQISEICNVRNHLTHYWNVIQMSKNNGIFWPNIIRQEKGIIWWYENPKNLIGMDSNYSQIPNSAYTINVKIMVGQDYEEIKKYISMLYSLCTAKINDWLTRNNLMFR
jgi:hypothetical protein